MLKWNSHLLFSSGYRHLVYRDGPVTLLREWGRFLATWLMLNGYMVRPLVALVCAIYKTNIL